MVAFLCRKIKETVSEKRGAMQSAHRGYWSNLNIAATLAAYAGGLRGQTSYRKYDRDCCTSSEPKTSMLQSFLGSAPSSRSFLCFFTRWQRLSRNARCLQ